MAQNEAPEFVDFEVEANFDEIQEFGGGYQLLPPGEYKLVVENIQQKTSSTNNPGVNVTFKVAEDQDTEEAAKYTGRLTFQYYTLLESGLGRLKNFMIACGAPLDKFRASACMGATIRGEIVHREGKAEPGPDGKVKEATTFANVVNEKPLNAEQPQQQTAAPPPVTKAKTTPTTAQKPSNNAQGRRA
jgi:hypothetical protein